MEKIKDYDIVQVKSDGGSWIDYATIKTREDKRSAAELIKNRNYRIVGGCNRPIAEQGKPI